jgi:hypothetical protein
MKITTIELPTGLPTITKIDIPLPQIVVESKRELIEKTFQKYMFQLSTQENINKLTKEILDLFIKDIRLSQRPAKLEKIKNKNYDYSKITF